MEEPLRLLILARSNPAAAERFLERHPGALEQRMDMGNTIMHLACALGHRPTVELLLGWGADPSPRNLMGRTPLAFACEAGKEALVRLLLERGAGWDEPDGQERSPLHLAAGAGSAPVVAALLEAGARVDAEDRLQFTPLFYALQVPSPHVTAMARAWSAQQRERVPDPIDYAGEEALRLAVIERLLEAGANPSHVGSCGQTPLHRAAEVAHLCPGLYRLLLARGADPQALDANGDPPEARLRR